MQFCEEEITWGELFEAFSNIYEKAKQIEEVNILQGLALARLLKSDLEEFINRIQTVTLKAIVCEVLSSYELEEELEDVEELINRIYENLNQLDNNLNNLNDRNDFKSLAQVEMLVSPLFNDFIDQKENLEMSVDSELEELFKPLMDLGASIQQIKEALEEVELADSPVDYILNVFMTIADKTLEDLD